MQSSEYSAHDEPVAVSVRAVSKSYSIAHQSRSTTLAEAATNALRRKRTSSRETFWALRDISFDVRRGEVVGVIGRNGAGKSTLLKLLSQITAPDSGEMRLRGRVGSLLEVGTGFHPELTGRENIFLNGAILGMKKREIDAQFDAIVDFAGVEQFLDTPVKRYSSGMYVRLAFAVAAQLNPEILIIDEVLAVGDAEFQKKCLGKMDEVSSQQGRTVFFVSHNMAPILKLCSHCLYLSEGRTVAYGQTEEVVARYVSALDDKLTRDLSTRTDRTGDGSARCTGLKLLDETGREIQRVLPNQPFFWQVFFDATRSFETMTISIDLNTSDGVRLASLYTKYTNQSFRVAQGEGSLLCRVSGLNILPGKYALNIMIGHGNGACDFIEGAATLEVADSDFFKTGRMPLKQQGVVLFDYSWQQP